MSRDVVVVDGLRTPYAKANTELKDVPAQDLGRIVTVELLARTAFDPAKLDQVIFGNIAQPPDAVNIARVAALRAEVPPQALQARHRPADGIDRRRVRAEHGRDGGSPGQGARHWPRGAGRFRAALSSESDDGAAEARRGDRARADPPGVQGHVRPGQRRAGEPDARST